MILNSPYITGSITVTGNANVQGTLTVTGSLSGTATSASLALNSNLLQGTGSVGFSTTASLLAVSSSQQQISASLLNVIANYATTGSNSFRANQSITGSLVVSSTITAQTLVVQTVTSSIVYSSGSNIFGNALTDRQTFTGSIQASGSSNHFLMGGNVGIGTTNPTHNLEIANAAGSVYQKLNADFGVGYMGMETADDSMRFVTGQATPIQFYTNNALRMTITNSGSVGIGIANPTYALDIVGATSSGALRVRNTGVQAQYTVDGTTGLFFRDGTNASWKSWLIATSYNDGSEISFIPSTNTSGAPTWGTTAMVIQGSGRVGIGTASPGSMLEVSGSIVSTTGQFSTTRTVTISALNTSVLIFSGAPSGIISARDNTNGGSGMWLHDPNGGSTLVAQNWINGVYTVFYSGGNTYVQKTSGNVPVIFHYVIYGN